LIYFGENINSVAGQHWQSFATQDYFDEHGIFYNVVVSAPALITLLTVLVSKQQHQHTSFWAAVVYAACTTTVTAGTERHQFA